GQSAEALVHRVPSGNRAGNVDGLDANGVDGGDAFGFEIANGERFGCPAAGIEAVQLTGFGLVIDHEDVSANAVHVGLNDAHHSIGCDGGINGIATLFKNVGAGLRGEKLRSGDDSEL